MAKMSNDTITVYTDMDDDTLDHTLNNLAMLLIKLVEAIEAQPPVTKYRYGEYMTAITLIVERKAHSTPEGLRRMQLGVGISLIRAGANKEGVGYALKYLGAL